MNEQELRELDTSEISKLPLATVGSQAPLVIDLPDGQKLVVGNLDPGTVIEIATWRGTGRPDSRTNRLMLGVSESEKEVPVSDRAGSKEPIDYSDSKSRLHEVTLDDEVDGVISERNSKRFKILRSKTPREEIQQSKNRGLRFTLKGLIKISVFTVAFVLIFGGLIGPGKMRIAHPHSGVGSSLGSAKNSLIIIKQGNLGKVGEAVIVDVADTKTSPVLAVVNTVQGDNYLLATNTLRFQSSKSSIHGKVQFVIPYLGYIATLIGK